MTPQTRALIEAAEESLDRFPCSCQKGQMTHCRCGDCVEVRLRAAISSAKAAEEGVETANVGVFDDSLHQASLACDCKKNGKFPCTICNRAWHQAWDLAEGKLHRATIISVREKEGL